jgi:lipopolysaccharide/colanic/teichoic acid biosynthesis glycosyltransferase
VRRLSLISIDLFLVTSATIIAVMLRGNFDTVSDSLIILMPYIFISVGCASVVFLVGGLDRTPWRFNSVADYLQVIVLSVLSILLTLVLTFALNRLAPVARSLPVLQGALIVSILVSARTVARLWHARKIHINGSGRVNVQPHQTVLVVGVNTITELFLLSVKEFAYQRVQVAGLLAEESSMRGRAIQQNKVLGTIEELPEVLQSLEVHGIAVDRIVVAAAADRLQPSALETLLQIEKSSNLVVQFLSEQLGFEDFSEKKAPVRSGQIRNSVPAQRPLVRPGNAIDVDHTNSARKSFQFRKRIVDIFGAILLIIMLSPILVIVAFVVALDVGFPLIFWQQRPGLSGRPFKLYKFRTMCPPHDRRQRRIPDDERSSTVGQIIRRTRLDELPQLYNVLVGDMSLIGPRPLLPCDQSPDYAARLSVRPGITGWAQVNGGRIISTPDKCILDIWYAQNASFTLDLKIILSTVMMVLFGDRINTEAVKQARNNLGAKMVSRTKMIPAE